MRYILTAILLATVLLGCSKSSDRQLVYDSDQCLREGKRAVILCPKYVDRCVIECREGKP
jgi:hypothetical protein